MCTLAEACIHFSLAEIVSCIVLFYRIKKTPKKLQISNGIRAKLQTNSQTDFVSSLNLVPTLSPLPLPLSLPPPPTLYSMVVQSEGKRRDMTKVYSEF